MAEVIKGLLSEIEGHLGDNTIYMRGNKTFIRPSHIRQPRRLSRKQLVLREQIAHNNILWRSLKATGHTYFEGGVDAYRRFMSVNTLSPVAYLTKQQVRNNFSLLLPRMAVSSGPLTPVSYQIDYVDGQPALLTDLTYKDIMNGQYLLYVLQQKVMPWQFGEDHAQIDISVVPITPGQDIQIRGLGTVRLTNVHSTILFVGDIFADSMFGFAIVRKEGDHVSSQYVITSCTYYQRYTTEEALQTAANSYGGLTPR